MLARDVDGGGLDRIDDPARELRRTTSGARPTVTRSRCGWKCAWFNASFVSRVVLARAPARATGDGPEIAERLESRSTRPEVQVRRGVLQSRVPGSSRARRSQDGRAFTTSASRSSNGLARGCSGSDPLENFARGSCVEPSRRVAAGRGAGSPQWGSRSISSVYPPDIGGGIFERPWGLHMQGAMTHHSARCHIVDALERIGAGRLESTGSARGGALKTTADDSSMGGVGAALGLADGGRTSSGYEGQLVEGFQHFSGARVASLPPGGQGVEARRRLVALAEMNGCASPTSALDAHLRGVSCVGIRLLCASGDLGEPQPPLAA